MAEEKKERTISASNRERLEKALDAFVIDEFNKKEARELRKAIQAACSDKYPKKAKVKKEKTVKKATKK